ncbi:MAG: PAS domain S-box protein [Sandaracinaceae bacterium]|nr:PAS domain S-box protein [Sandaracinaceae bacterium]
MSQRDDDRGAAARAPMSEPPVRDSQITAKAAPGETGKRQRYEVMAARRAAAADQGTLEAPSSEELLYKTLELNRTVNVEMQDEAIVHVYVAALRDLFPRRRVAVRLVAAESGELAIVYATGRLDERSREGVVLSRDAMERHELTVAEAARAGADVGADYAPVFAEPGAGFDIPLIQAGHLMGVMNVELDPGLDEPAYDRSLIVPLAVQLGAALRNARLLRESRYLRDNLEKLLDHANAPILVIGRDRELRVVNRAFLAVTGASRDALLGRDFLSLLPETERGRILPVFIRALRGEPTSNFEVRLPRSRGGYSRIVINTASVLAPDGEIDAVIAIGRDLTELRELENQMIQAEKLVTLGQLAAGVVHELNNPLTSISVYGEYLLRKGERSGNDPADLEKMRRIVESADRILKFTRDLVTYARPSTEEPAFVRVRDVVEQSLLFCDHVVSEVGANVVRRFACGDARVYGVKGQLHQVFINLITNACHAMPAGQGELVVAIDADDDDHLAIRIADNGVGIPTAQREKIFEPFFSTKGEGQGTGLGLSIVKNIVAQHGGTIRVEPNGDVGTVFVVRLPGRPS